MKIAQVTATFPPYMSGTGNACYNFSVELAKLGHDVTVFTSDFPKQHYVYPENIKIVKLPTLFKIGNAPFLPGLLMLKGFDVIHLHYPFFFGAEMVYMAARIRHMKYIVSYHNDTMSKGLTGLYFRIYRHTIMKLILSGSSKIIVSSLDYGRHSFLKNLIEHNNNKIIEIPYGVDPKRFNPDVDCVDIKTKYDLYDKKVVLFVGGLDTPHFFKGVDYLIKSFKEISDDARLIIVGEGNLKAKYMRVAKELGIEEKVIFTGRISDEDLPKYYAVCDVFVLPSVTMGEAFGIVLLEAMATGKPVIASDLPGVRTVVDNGVNGLLVEPKNEHELANQLRILLNDKSFRTKFGENGMKKVEDKYSWSIVSKNLESVLYNVYTNVKV